MGHKYNRRAGTWNMSYRYCDTTTIIRTCPICGFSQPLNAFTIAISDFSECPSCKSKLDMPKRIEY